MVSQPVPPLQSSVAALLQSLGQADLAVQRIDEAIHDQSAQAANLTDLLAGAKRAIQACQSFAQALVSQSYSAESYRETNTLLAGGAWFQALFDATLEGILITDLAGMLVSASPAASTLLDRTPENLIGQPVASLVAPDDCDAFAEAWQRLLTDGHIANQIRLTAADGEFRVVEFVARANLVHGEAMAIIRDVTDRHRAENAPDASEARYRQLLETSSEGIMLLDRDDRVMYVNQRMAALVGYTAAEITSQPYFMLQDTQGMAAVHANREPRLRGLADRHDAQFTGKDGETLGAVVSVSPLTDASGQSNGSLIIVTGVTDRRQVKELAGASEARLQALMEAAPDAIVVADASGRMLAVNPQTESLFGYRRDELIGQPVEMLLPPALREQHTSHRHGFMASRSVRPMGGGLELRGIRKDGTEFPAEISLGQMETPEGHAVISLIRDISLRKAIEAQRLRAESRYRDLVERLPAITYITALDRPELPLYLSPQTQRLLGYSSTDFESQPNLWASRVHPDDRERVFAAVARTISAGEPLAQEYRMLASDGHIVWFQDEAVVTFTNDGQRRVIEGVMYDISPRKTAEESLLQLAAIVESSSDSITATTLDGVFTSWNHGAERLYGFQADEAIGHDQSLIVPSGRADQVLNTLERIGRGETVAPFETVRVRSDGNEVAVSLAVSPVRNANGEIHGAAFIGRDITEWKRLEAENLQQLQRLSSLRAIDMSIAASMDLRVTLAVLLDQVTGQLGVDAACILQLNPVTQTLEYAAGRGFRGRGISRSRLYLGEGLAGRSAQERRVVHVRRLTDSEAQFLNSALITGEDFVSYIVSPLIAKGQIMGVLELYQRSPLAPDPEWFEFLEALAGQAAIAIDGSTLFDELQRTNLDLSIAYDATIAGWARALELRDAETEGHSRRVVDMTLRLAQALGVSDNDLVQVRRGAFLHDIGKMAVPDSILLKPGPLTEKEWVTMRQHPVYAYEMLLPIAYLRPALDIPYYHHEKWDGTGYPRGLEGEQIPLSARAFAVSDVWDALIARRPYKEPWPRERVVEYIRSQAGLHFDPRVVETFLILDLE